MESGVEPYQLKDLLPLLRENHPLQMLAIAVATNDLATGMQNATLVYFFLYVMHNKDLQPIATVVGAPFMLVAILLAPYIAKKNGSQAGICAGQLGWRAHAGCNPSAAPFCLPGNYVAADGA